MMNFNAITNKIHIVQSLFDVFITILSHQTLQKKPAIFNLSLIFQKKVKKKKREGNVGKKCFTISTKNIRNLIS